MPARTHRGAFHCQQRTRSNLSKLSQHWLDQDRHQVPGHVRIRVKLRILFGSIITHCSISTRTVTVPAVLSELNAVAKIDRLPEEKGFREANVPWWWLIFGCTGSVWLRRARDCEDKEVGVRMDPFLTRY
jgi:hypothetical protein